MRYCLLILAFLLIAVVVMAGDKAARPNYTGTWEMNLKRSHLELAQPPTRTVFIIKHDEPYFHLSRTHWQGEKSNNFTADFKTDGTEIVHDGAHIRVHWRGDQLVFDSYWIDGGQKVTNFVKYSLADGGKTFIADETVSGGSHDHHNIWVFDRVK